MRDPAVIVLLVHNAEQRIHGSVERVLAISDEVACPTSVVVVDDGSTDETYEIACELATIYPQLCVLRQPRQNGLGAALERVRQTVRASRAIVHDGISPLNAGDLAALLQEAMPAAEGSEQAIPSSDESRGSRRFAAVRRLNDALERAHRPLTAFRWLPLDQNERSRDACSATDSGETPVQRRTHAGV